MCTVNLFLEIAVKINDSTFSRKVIALPSVGVRSRMAKSEEFYIWRAFRRYLACSGQFRRLGWLLQPNIVNLSIVAGQTIEPFTQPTGYSFWSSVG